MQITKIIAGRKVIFTTRIQTMSRNWAPKVIDIYIDGAAPRFATDWVDAWERAKESVEHANKQAAQL